MLLLYCHYYDEGEAEDQFSFGAQGLREAPGTYETQLPAPKPKALQLSSGIVREADQLRELL